ncbi:hypothetical protein H4W33_007155 [Kibdelosporangium phytohabitans]|nr:hypothetical protein [Kibdelosporangium phytohabitans]
MDRDLERRTTALRLDQDRHPDPRLAHEPRTQATSRSPVLLRQLALDVPDVHTGTSRAKPGQPAIGPLGNPSQSLHGSSRGLRSATPGTRRVTHPQNIEHPRSPEHGPHPHRPQTTPTSGIPPTTKPDHPPNRPHTPPPQLLPHHSPTGPIAQAETPSAHHHSQINPGAQADPKAKSAYTRLDTTVEPTHTPSTRSHSSALSSPNATWPSCTWVTPVTSPPLPQIATAIQRHTTRDPQPQCQEARQGAIANHATATELQQPHRQPVIGANRHDAKRTRQSNRPRRQELDHQQSVQRLTECTARTTTHKVGLHPGPEVSSRRAGPVKT